MRKPTKANEKENRWRLVWSSLHFCEAKDGH